MKRISIILSFFLCVTVWAQEKINAVTETKSETVFVENAGQWNSDVLFFTRINGMDAWITKTGVVYNFTEVTGDKEKYSARKFALPGEDEIDLTVNGQVVKTIYANSIGNVTAETFGKRNEYRNYFIGQDKSRWRSRVGVYDAVTIKNIYKKIDVRYYYDEGNFRYDFVVNPGGDPSQIAIDVEGSNGIEINSEGSLVLLTSLGNVYHSDLKAYGKESGKNILCSFTKYGENRIRFNVQTRNQTEATIIDPRVYGTFFGGSAFDDGKGIAQDESEHLYVTGTTFSTNFPVTTGAYSAALSGQSDVYIACFENVLSSGGTLAFSTYLGGTTVTLEEVWAIELGPDGGIYVTGETGSNDFPVTSGVYDETYNGYGDVFVSKLSSDGAALLLSTYLGGIDGTDRTRAMKVDNVGKIFLTGNTLSADYPVTNNAYDRTFNGATDILISVLSQDFSQLLYSTFLGAYEREASYGIVPFPDGSILVGGLSLSTDYPTTVNAFDRSFGGDYDIVLTKIAPNGTDLFFSTFIGGSSREAIANTPQVDGEGNIYISGFTRSQNFPITAGAYDGVLNGGSDIFAAKVSPDGSRLLRSTLIGGNGGGTDFREEIVHVSFLTESGSLVLSGITPSSDFPVTPDAFDKTPNGGLDAYITVIDTALSTLLYSTYIGGANDDFTSDMTTSEGQLIFLTGPTYSADFPAGTNGFDQTYNGQGDAFIFGLSISSFTILSPNGGEVFQTGDDVEIKWYSAAERTLKIEYTAGNNEWVMLSESYPSTSGSFHWTIPALVSDSCKVRITDLNDPGSFDESDGFFSIEQIVRAEITADTTWLDEDFTGAETREVSAANSIGAIISYEWKVNGETAGTGASLNLALETGTNNVLLTVTDNLGQTAFDSTYISVYSAVLATNGAIRSGITQTENRFYVTSEDKGVYGFDSTAASLPAYLTGGSIRSVLSVSSKNMLYVGSDDTRLYCFDPSLNSYWDKSIGGVIQTSPSITSDGNTLYLGTTNHLLKAMDANTGAPRWSFVADGEILSSPVLLELTDSTGVLLETVVYFATTNGTVYALKDNGSAYETFWSVTLGATSGFVSTASLSSNGMIYFTSTDGYLYRFNWNGYFADDWKVYTGGALRTSAVIGESEIVYVISESGNVCGYDQWFTESSEPVRFFEYIKNISGTPTIGTDGTVYAAFEDGKFLALENTGDINLTKLWEFTAGSGIESAVLVTESGLIVFGTVSGEVYIMKRALENGTSLALTWPTFKGDNKRSKVMRLSGDVSGTDESIVSVPKEYTLMQNFPNPFNPVTIVRYGLPKESRVTVNVYTVLGELAAQLVDTEQRAGYYEVDFNGQNLASGIYFYSVQAEALDGSSSFREVKKMMLVK